jgi:hypothetical protein
MNGLSANASGAPTLLDARGPKKLDQNVSRASTIAEE